MSNYHISRRLQFIIQYVNDKVLASKEDIIDFLATKDINTSERTLERDLRNIRTDFGIELSYDKSKNKYYIDKEKSVKVESFFKFLELVTIADVFSDGLKENNKILEYVVFDDSSHFKGIDNLEVILIAIKQGREIEFNHYNYYKETLNPYIITPLIIKEYLNRWYVIGVPEGENEIRTFGIDRIQDLKLGKLFSIKKESFEKQLSQFDNIIGLNFNEDKPKHIVLKVNNFHIKYLNSLPLHSSQHIYDCDEDGFSFVSYDLIPNYEFEIQILKMSLELEVLEPLEYRELIKSKIKSIYTKYQD
jgi:predicted DNA-binding transcriptional regulator YafY